MISELDIKNLVETSKKVKIDEINCSDSEKTEVLKIIYQFIQNIELSYLDLLEKLVNSKFRFCDYYSYSMLHGKDIINYFNDNYFGPNKDEMIDIFSIYVLLKNLSDIIVMKELCESYDELYKELDNDKYFLDVLYMISFINERKLEKESFEEIGLQFLNKNNKYKILFSGLAFDDIKGLEKNVKKSFISKLSGALCQSDHIPLSEAVDHVKSMYDFPLQRIQFSDDYRIAFIRKNNITVILGVTIKTGKPIDYTRYDSVAKRKNEIYEEIELFITENLPPEAQHFKVLNYLQEFNKKIQIKK